jgi:hypothetical protein
VLNSVAICPFSFSSVNFSRTGNNSSILGSNFLCSLQVQQSHGVCERSTRFLGGIRSTFTIALLTPARGGSKCESVCSAVHRLIIPFELVWNQPSLSLWKDCMIFPSLLRNFMMHSSFLINSPSELLVFVHSHLYAG